MSKSTRSIMIGALVALYVLGGVAAPSFAEPSKCDAAKVKAAGKRLAAKANCQAKALQKDVAVDPECLTKAEQKFATAFQKADEKNDNCTNTGNAAAVGSTADACVADLVSDVTVACAAGELDCAGVCVDPDTDEQNCGNCGTVCPIGGTCISGACQATCAAGELDCAGVCVDPDTDEQNCGNCDIVCAGGEVCTAGACAPAP